MLDSEKSFDVNSVLDFKILNLPSNHSVAVYCYKPEIQHLSQINGTIYFLHGVAGNTKIWRHQIKYFVMKLWLVISLDFIGHGNSEKSYKSKEYNFDSLAKDALHIYDEYRNLSEMNVVVGHSYGCSIATYIAHYRKENVKRLVLISGGGPAALGAPPFLFYLCTCCLSCFHPLIIKNFRKRAYHKPPKSSSVSAISQYTTAGASTPPDQGLVSYEDMVDSIRISSRVLKAMMLGQYWPEGDEDFHRKIQVPTLLIYGSCDAFVPVDEEYEMLEALPIAVYHEIKDTGHMVMLEAPKQINMLIEEHCYRQNFPLRPSIEAGRRTTARSLVVNNNNNNNHTTLAQQLNNHPVFITKRPHSSTDATIINSVSHSVKHKTLPSRRLSMSRSRRKFHQLSHPTNQITPISPSHNDDKTL